MAARTGAPAIPGAPEAPTPAGPAPAPGLEREVARITEVVEALQEQLGRLREALNSLRELVEGKSLEEAAGLSTLFKRMMQGEGLSRAEAALVNALEPLLAVRGFPVRIKCALLGWMALEEGIEAYQTKQAQR